MVRIVCVNDTDAGIYPQSATHQFYPMLSADAKPFLPWLIDKVSFLPPTLRSIVRVTTATALDTLALHLAVIVATWVVFRVLSRIRPSPLITQYDWHLPSVALLFASISSSFLLTFLLVWEPHLPCVTHSEHCMDAELGCQPCSTLPLSSHPAVAAVQAWISTLSTQWLVRNLIGGMSAGVALGTVVPDNPFAGVFVLLLGTWFQSLIRNTVVQLPASHKATYLLQSGSLANRISVAAYCQP